MARHDPATGDGAAYEDNAVDGGAPPGVPADGSPTTTGGAVPVDPAAVKTQPVADKGATPELREWGWTKIGGLMGHVHGREGFRPGHKLATSRITEFSPACKETCEQHPVGERLRYFQRLTVESAATLCEGALVITKSLSLYRLGAPRPTAATLDQGAPDAAQLPVRVEAAADDADPAPNSPLETHEDSAPAARSALAPTVPEAASVAAREVPTAARANFSADEPSPMAPVVSEAEGYQLKLSAWNKTGYLNVSACTRPSGTFVVGLTGGGKSREFVFGFATAVEAALWLAKFTAGEDPQTPSGKHLKAGRHHSTSSQPQVAALAPAGPLAAPATDSADASAEVDGYTLKLSRSNRTGYMNVYPGFYVKFQVRGDGLKQDFPIYGFTTAVVAALWLAKYSAGEDPPMPRGGKFRPTGPLAPQRPKAAVPAVAAAAPQEEGGAHSSDGSAVAPPPVLAWADGMELIVSDKSATGYECVVRERGGSFVVNSKRFRNTKRNASGRPKRQLYATAQEAAVVFARMVAAARQQQQPGEDADSDQEMNDAPDGSEVRPVVPAPCLAGSSTGWLGYKSSIVCA